MVHDQDVAMWEAQCREGGTFALLSLHCLGGEEKSGVNMFSSSVLPGRGRVTNGKSKNVEICLWNSLLSANSGSLLLHAVNLPVFWIGRIVILVIKSLGM